MAIGKSQLFPALPQHLSRYEKWLPVFNLVAGPLSYVRVIFRAKDSASAMELDRWREQENSLPRAWWESVFIPAINSLPSTAKTRRLNTTSTFMATGVLPTYVRLYKADIAALDRALVDSSRSSTLTNDFEWHFVCWQLGQRHELEPNEELDPTAFGLADLFDTSCCSKFSAHIGFNLRCTDPAYSVFWDSRRIYNWSTTHPSELQIQ